MQRVLQHGPTAHLPALAHVAGLAEQRRVILTCEKAIVLLDIISKRVCCFPSPSLPKNCLFRSMQCFIPVFPEK